MASGALEQSALEAKDREQLVAIAGALGVKSASRAKKAELIEMILEQTKPTEVAPKPVKKVEAPKADKPAARTSAPAAPALGADGFQRRHVLAPGVVDQAVNGAVLGHDGGHAASHGVFLANIAGVQARRVGHAVLGHFSGYPLQLLDLAPQQRYLRAQGSQFMRHATANARAAARDDDDLACKQTGREDGGVRHKTL